MSADCPLTVVVLIPVMIPVNPSTLSIDVIFSVLNGGKSIMTCGGVRFEYPKPGFVIDISVTVPLVIVAVEVAVVQIPTPITGGAVTLTVALAYPLPAFVISNDLIDPEDETIAVADAPTLISPDVTRASTVLNDKL